MASKKPEPKPDELVFTGRQLVAERDQLLARLADVEAQLIAMGPGLYCDPGDAAATCTVVGAVEASQKPDTFALPAGAEQEARDLAGEAFGKLFDRAVSFTPCGGFELVAPKLLTPARSRGLVELCRVAGRVTPARRAYVKW